MGDWELSSKGILVDMVLGNDPGAGVQSRAIRQNGHRLRLPALRRNGLASW